MGVPSSHELPNQDDEMSATLALRRFEYLRPGSIDEAVKLKVESGAGAFYWAGGTDIALEWKRRQRSISHCIDITRLDGLKGISAEKGRIRIGALTSLAALERARGRQPLLDVLADLAHVMCTPQTRTIATVGGNLCNASPAADLAPPLIAFDAVVLVTGPAGERSIPVGELFAGVKRTVLNPDDLVTAVEFPLGERKRGAYSRMGRTVVDIALVIAAVALDVGADGRISLARIALGSVAPTPIRVASAEARLLGLPLDGLSGVIDAVAEEAAAGVQPITDVRTTAAYRREASRVLVKRALDETVMQLRDGGTGS
jgi:CO/xanthine dehydrogenase FAD-binding subunit